MFVRKKQNKSGSISIQIISKSYGKYICISFTAYCIYKELQRVLYKEESSLSVKKAAELTQNMYQISYMLPESKHTKTRLLKMDDMQAELYRIVIKNF